MEDTLFKNMQVEVGEMVYIALIVEEERGMCVEVAVSESPFCLENCNMKGTGILVVRGRTKSSNVG